MIAERSMRAVAYEPKFDQRIGLKDSYIARQVDTFIGERLNVLLSLHKYEIKNDLIYGQDMEEPFIKVMRRGVDYRRKVEGENRVDRNREEAEVEGFLKTQEILCDSQTSIGTMMLSVSPIGGKDSLYQHNFYDIFTLKELDGKRFIEARRYSGTLTVEEYKDKLSPLSFMGNISDDADFLKNPIKIDDVFFKNSDEIHSYLHENHKVINVEEFERIMKACERLKREYVRSKDPRVLDAIINKADMEAGFIDRKISSNIPLTLNREIDFYGHQPVRVVATGCGSSGSTSLNSLIKKSSPFSVSEFGLEDDSYGSREFDCPECGKTNIRPKDKLLKNCQHCNSSKVSC